MSLDSNVEVQLYSDHIKEFLGGQQLDRTSSKSHQSHILERYFDWLVQSFYY